MHAENVGQNGDLKFFGPDLHLFSLPATTETPSVTRKYADCDDGILGEWRELPKRKTLADAFFAEIVSKHSK